MAVESRIDQKKREGQQAVLAAIGLLSLTEEEVEAVEALPVRQAVLIKQKHVDVQAARPMPVRTVEEKTEGGGKEGVEGEEKPEREWGAKTVAILTTTAFGPMLAKIIKREESKNMGKRGAAALEDELLEAFALERVEDGRAWDKLGLSRVSCENIKSASDSLAESEGKRMYQELLATDPTELKEKKRIIEMARRVWGMYRPSFSEGVIEPEKLEGEEAVYGGLVALPMFADNSVLYRGSPEDALTFLQQNFQEGYRGYMAALRGELEGLDLDVDDVIAKGAKADDAFKPDEVCIIKAKEWLVGERTRWLAGMIKKGGVAELQEVVDGYDGGEEGLVRDLLAILPPKARGGLEDLPSQDLREELETRLPLLKDIRELRKRMVVKGAMVVADGKEQFVEKEQAVRKFHQGEFAFNLRGMRTLVDLLESSPEVDPDISTKVKGLLDSLGRTYRDVMIVPDGFKRRREEISLPFWLQKERERGLGRYLAPSAFQIGQDGLLYIGNALGQALRDDQKGLMVLKAAAKKVIAETEAAVADDYPLTKERQRKEMERILRRFYQGDLPDGVIAAVGEALDEAPEQMSFRDTFRAALAVAREFGILGELTKDGVVGRAKEKDGERVLAIAALAGIAEEQLRGLPFAKLKSYIEGLELGDQSKVGVLDVVGPLRFMAEAGGLRLGERAELAPDITTDSKTFTWQDITYMEKKLENGGFTAGQQRAVDKAVTLLRGVLIDDTVETGIESLDRDKRFSTERSGSRILAFMGPTGSGKTTIARAIAEVIAEICIAKDPKLRGRVSARVLITECSVTSASPEGYEGFSSQQIAGNEAEAHFQAHGGSVKDKRPVTIYIENEWDKPVTPSGGTELGGGRNVDFPTLHQHALLKILTGDEERGTLDLIIGERQDRQVVRVNLTQENAFLFLTGAVSHPVVQREIAMRKRLGEDMNEAGAWLKILMDDVERRMRPITIFVPAPTPEEAEERWNDERGAFLYLAGQHMQDVNVRLSVDGEAFVRSLLQEEEILEEAGMGIFDVLKKMTPHLRDVAGGGEIKRRDFEQILAMMDADKGGDQTLNVINHVLTGQAQRERQKGNFQLRAAVRRGLRSGG